VVVRGFGNEVVESWMDMSKMVAGSGDKKSPFESLASSIGMWRMYGTKLKFV
jgi:hypothetical protein